MNSIFALIISLLSITSGQTSPTLAPTATSAKYIYVGTSKSWEDAEQHCIDRYGTNLASITDLVSDNDATNLCGSNKCWIGFNDRDNEGIFEWSDGSSTTSFEATRWGSGFPKSNTDCVRFKENGEWRTNKCTNKFPFLCNIPTPTPAPTPQPTGSPIPWLP